MSPIYPRPVKRPWQSEWEGLLEVNTADAREHRATRRHQWPSPAVLLRCQQFRAGLLSDQTEFRMMRSSMSTMWFAIRTISSLMELIFDMISGDTSLTADLWGSSCQRSTPSAPSSRPARRCKSVSKPSRLSARRSMFFGKTDKVSGSSFSLAINICYRHFPDRSWLMQPCCRHLQVATVTRARFARFISSTAAQELNRNATFILACSVWI